MNPLQHRPLSAELRGRRRVCHLAAPRPPSSPHGALSFVSGLLPGLLRGASGRVGERRDRGRLLPFSAASPKAPAAQSCCFPLSRGWGVPEDPDRATSSELLRRNLLQPAGFLLRRPPRPPGAVSCDDSPVPKGSLSSLFSRPARPRFSARRRGLRLPPRGRAQLSRGPGSSAETGLPWCPRKPAQHRRERRTPGFLHCGTFSSSLSPSPSVQGGSRTVGRGPP